MAKIDFVCKTCGGNNVVADAYAEWSVEEQRWEISSVFDKGAYCNDCDGETRLKEVEVQDD